MSEYGAKSNRNVHYMENVEKNNKKMCSWEKM